MLAASPVSLSVRVASLPVNSPGRITGKFTYRVVADLAGLMSVPEPAAALIKQRVSVLWFLFRATADQLHLGPGPQPFRTPPREFPGQLALEHSAPANHSQPLTFHMHGERSLCIPAFCLACVAF